MDKSKDFQEFRKIHESKMSKEQIEVAKVMAKMSPEDLAKLKEQMNE